MTNTVLQLPVQSNILDMYENIQLIHSGGEGRIASAQRKNDGKNVVIKWYNKGNIDNWDDFNKAQEGAEKEIAFLYIAKEDNIKNVARIIEHGITGPLQEPVMVMEPIVGETLEQRLTSASFNPTIKGAVQLARDVAETLRYAHEEVGIEPFIHRDIKPANIMVDSERTKVIDWSTGKFGSGDTINNTVLWSRYYIAPEVENGESVSRATDVYGLGKVLQHYLLKNEFIKKKGKVTEQDFNGKIPEHIVKALSKATELDPKERYQSIDEFVKVFENNKLVVSDSKNMELANVGFLEDFETGGGLIGMSVGTAIGLLGGLLLYPYFGEYIIPASTIISCASLITIGKEIGHSIDEGMEFEDLIAPFTHPIDTFKLRKESREYKRLVKQWKKQSFDEILYNSLKSQSERRLSGKLEVNNKRSEKPLGDNLSPWSVQEIKKLFDHYKRINHDNSYANCSIASKEYQEGSYMQYFKFRGKTPSGIEYLWDIIRSSTSWPDSSFDNSEKKYVSIIREHKIGGEITSPDRNLKNKDDYDKFLEEAKSSISSTYGPLWQLAQLIPHPKRSYLTLDRI